MTIQEFFTEAESFGGWFIDKNGLIRNKKRPFTEQDLPEEVRKYNLYSANKTWYCCPMAVVFNCTTYDAKDKAISDPNGLSVEDAEQILRAADLEDGYNPEYRKIMESWCNGK